MLIRALLLSLATLFALPAMAQGNWPTKPLRVIVPFPPGGGADTIARLLQQPLSTEIGQPVVIDNRSGAAGLVGTEAVVRSAPDGYTIGIVISSLPAAVALRQQLGFDPVRDPTPIVLIGTAPNVIVVHPDVPAKTLGELVALAKDKTFNYGSGGVGSSHHFGGEYLQLVTGGRFEHTPYRGGGPLIADVVGGQIPMAFTTIQSILPHIQAGRVRPLAVTSPQRAPQLPDVPAVAEVVGKPYDIVDWWGIVGPKDLPAPLRERLNAVLRKVLTNPDVAERLGKLGMTMRPGSADDFSAVIRDDVEKLSGIVRSTGMKVE